MDEEDRIHRGPEEALSPRDRFERACRAQGSRPLDKGGSR
jgi:hypothetical protein